MIEFTELNVAANLAIFAAAAVAVWIAGVRITRHASVISSRAGLDQALVGMLLLGGVTSLPEVVVSVTASLSGQPRLAVNSVLGGIAMQVAILAVADMMIGRKALTAVVPNPVVFLQGAFKILLLSIVISAILVGDTAVLGIGLWMWLLLGVSALAMWTLTHAKDRRPWRVGDDELEENEKRNADEEAHRHAAESLSSTVVMTTLTALVIVGAGYLLSSTGDAIAKQTGLGESFVGVALVAIATSLPEVSTVIAAARAGLYTMAVSDIFGTNLFDITLLFVVDAASGGDAVMSQVGRFSAFAAIVGIAVTAIFLAGIAERRDRTVLRMGLDSAAVLVTYLASLVALYFLR